MHRKVKVGRRGVGRSSRSSCWLLRRVGWRLGIGSTTIGSEDRCFSPTALREGQAEGGGTILSIPLCWTSG